MFTEQQQQQQQEYNYCRVPFLIAKNLAKMTKALYILWKFFRGLTISVQSTTYK